MTIVINAPGADFSGAPVGRALPSAKILSSLFLFGVDVTRTTTNLIIGGPASALSGAGAGAPVVGSNYVEFGTDVWLDSNVNLSGDTWTMAAVAQVPTDHQVVGSNHSGIAGHMVFRSGTELRAVVNGTGANPHTTLPAFGTPLFMCFTHSQTNGGKLYLGNGGALEVTDFPFEAATNTANIVFGPADRFGAQPGATPHRHYGGACGTQELLPADVADLYAWFDVELARRGVSVA